MRLEAPPLAAAKFGGALQRPDRVALASALHPIPDAGGEGPGDPPDLPVLEELAGRHPASICWVGELDQQPHRVHRTGVQQAWEQVHRLLSTFSDWRPEEVDQAARAVDRLGGAVIEHYQTLLHILRRAWPHGLHDQTAGASARETGEVSAT